MVLRANNITKYFQDGNQKQVVIDRLTINFPKTGCVFVTGSSGSGKSTLLNLLAGIENVAGGFDHPEQPRYKNDSRLLARLRCYGPPAGQPAWFS